MAFKRGRKSVEVELANVQSWCETTSEELDGVDGRPGLIDKLKEMIMREDTQKQASEDSAKKWTRLCALFTAVPVLLKVAEVFHWIPK